MLIWLITQLELSSDIHIHIHFRRFRRLVFPIVLFWAALHQFKTYENYQKTISEFENTKKNLLALRSHVEWAAAAIDQHSILKFSALAYLEPTGSRASAVLTLIEFKEQLNWDAIWGLSKAYISVLKEQLTNAISSERSCFLHGLTHILSELPGTQIFGAVKAWETDRLITAEQKPVILSVDHEEGKLCETGLALIFVDQTVSMINLVHTQRISGLESVGV